jgi:hypothetical protein
VFPSAPSAILPPPYYMARGKPADFWEPLQLDRRTALRGLHQLDGIARLAHVDKRIVSSNYFGVLDALRAAE